MHDGKIVSFNTVDWVGILRPFKMCATYPQSFFSGKRKSRRIWLTEVHQEDGCQKEGGDIAVIA